LWLASPEFVQLLSTEWEGADGRKSQRFEQTLYRYLARMTARATPFGAFAGCSTGEIAGSTRLELAPRSHYGRHSRLDMEYLCGLAEKLSNDPARRGQLRFRCNTSLHLTAGKYHHLRGDWRERGQVFTLVATDPTPALQATLSRAASGATADALATALAGDDPEITAEDADTFIGQLIESKLLVSDLAPPVTGMEPILYMAGQLQQAGAMDLATELLAVEEKLREMDRGGLGADPRAYDDIVRAVSRLGGEFVPGRLVHVDVCKPAAAACLDSRLVDELLDAVQKLHSTRDDSGLTIFAQFKADFQDRYREREVPLLEALDDEAGIGFEQEENPTTEPLIAGIDFFPGEEATPDEEAKRRIILERRLDELRARKQTVLVLDSGLLDELKAANTLPLPDAFSVMGSVFRTTEGQLGFYAHTIFGPSGANLLARFRHDGEGLAEHVQAHVTAEESLHAGSAVFAEIVHLPEGRAGNVLCRPALRQFEIPFLATPGLPADRQIPLSDLSVSVRDNSIVLRSRRLGAEVLPRLTSAHNYASPRSLKLYKFLCMLQHQDTCQEVFWDWGSAGRADFLPRVMLGNIVFSLACWKIGGETAVELAQGRLTLARWRKSNLVPRFAFIAEFDNQLLVDFENPLAVETFLEHIRKQPETLLVEMFPPPGELLVRGPEGSFVHEIILPVVRKRGREPAAPEASLPEKSSLRSIRPAPALALAPGSDWLFTSLYCSPSHADRLLTAFVRPLVAELALTGAASLWFFIRYGDPRWHLRLRFHGHPEALSGQVLPLLLRRASEHERLGTLWRMELGTYEREVERYGGPRGMAIAERFFHLDSELCLVLLGLTSGDNGARVRWQLAAAGVHRLLGGLGFTLAEKKTLLENLRDFRERDFQADENYRRQVAEKFRGQRQILSAIVEDLDGDAHPPSVLPPAALSAFARSDSGIHAVCGQLRTASASGELSKTIPELAADFIHMRLNRMFRSAHLAQEAVLYHFLARTYATKLARQSRQGPAEIEN